MKKTACSLHVALISTTALQWLGSLCASSDHPELHAGEHDFNDHYHSDNFRNHSSANIWRSHSHSQCGQHHAKRRHQRCSNHVFRDRCNQALQLGSGHSRCRTGRANRHYSHRDYQRYYQFIVGVLAVILCAAGKANEGGTTAIANPVATSTGSVSNQAVQINQGSYSQQGFGNGHICNSSTMVLTPFYLGNDVNNPEAPYIRNQNYGAQVSFSFPLDGGMVELCKELARKKLAKERLDYELVRVLKCAELLKSGYMLHPSSPYAHVCSDVVPIAAVQTTK